MNDVLYINGRFTTTAERVIGVEDRGFQFGDAVYEVFKFLGRRPVFLRRSLPAAWRTDFARSRFVQSVGRSSVCVDHARADARTAFDDGIVYIQVSRGEAERAHFYPDDLQPTVVAYSRAFTFPDAAKKERGIRLVTSTDLRWKHCDVKSVNLLANVLAKKKAQRAGADEVLLIDDGIVREGASSQFLWSSRRRGRSPIRSTSTSCPASFAIVWSTWRALPESASKNGLSARPSSSTSMRFSLPARPGRHAGRGHR